MPSSKTSIDKRDVYYRKGKSLGYRARSAWKLLHLDEEFDLFRGVNTAVDLCAAPGSWSQVLGQKLRPGTESGKKVVCIDLQPMAPLPNITLLQTDITLPSTIPLVIRALGGRQADLVVCDGAPDVTGVHDLDAYLHSQLLLAALTLSLTLLAPHSTLIFKIFLSPLDPQGAMLRSQLQPFFPGPPTDQFYDEFDDQSTVAEDLIPMENVASQTIDDKPGEPSSPEAGFDLLGRRGGVWVRKPRSSRKGSGEAFLVCRNFDRSRVPLPATFSEKALDSLAQQQGGTLTLESLSSLGGPQRTSKEWELIKAYVGSGNFDCMFGNPTLLKPSTSTMTPEIPVFNGVISISSPPSVHIRLPNSGHPPPPRLHLPDPSPARRAIGLPSPTSRQSSLDSLSPTTASPSPLTSFHQRPWDRSCSPLPSPGISYSGPSEGMLAVPPPIPESSLAEEDPRDAGVWADGAVSPSLSTNSKTDSFFSKAKVEPLPEPPKPLASIGLGKGLPGQVQERHRAVSSPAPVQLHPPVPFPGSTSIPNDVNSIAANNSSLQPISRHVSTPLEPPYFHSRRFTGTSIPSERLATLPSEPSVSPSARHTPLQTHTRRGSHFEREHAEAELDVTLSSGQILTPSSTSPTSPSNYHDTSSLSSPPYSDVTLKSLTNQGQGIWRLESPLGQGAFSTVWSATRLPMDEHKIGTVAIKMMDKRLCLSNARTRIAFLREVEVLRHISHPNIVGYLDSFSTRTHHCLVLERMGGGELFDLVSDETKRMRMMLPGPKGDNGEEGDDGDGFLKRVFGEICKGVGWLHEVGVVHRDLKLENILLTVNPLLLPPTSTNSIPLHLLPRPLIKITDFGLARFIDPTSPLLETRCGSESFAAPEIIMGRPYDGRLTDAWALGVILFALMTGELPFDPPPSSGQEGRWGEREERKRRMMRIAKAEYTLPRNVSEGSKRVIERLLVRDPGKRSWVKDIWQEEWMSVGDGNGGIESQWEEGDEGGDREGGLIDGLNGRDGFMGRGARKVMEGFLVDGDGIDEVARSEES
ncbi:CAMK protein kinase [Tremella mesenterica]|uniref:CAMK protein kinase n=1 Tax=Tremella mesenterica TaxID=5217 RepID=A0A4Q1BS08_TREME|nr:CAMK protein kinase [Tremella mesenterica]